MRYELDNEGYILNVFFGCISGSCIEYTGTIPDGYDSLGEWAENANIRAYKLVDGNLAFDATRDAILQAEYEKEADDNRTVVYKEIKNITNIVNEDIVEMYMESTSNLAKISKATDSNKFASKFIYLKANKDITGSIQIKFNNSNFLTNDAISKNESGISFEVNEDRSININGTAESDIEFNIAGTNTNTKTVLTLKKDTNYYLSSGRYTVKMYSYDGTNRTEVYAGNGGVINFTDDDKNITQIVLSIPNGSTFNNNIIYPMLNLGTEAEPYVMYEGNIATIDLENHTFKAGDNIKINDGIPTLQNEIYINNNLYIGNDFIIGGSLYELSEIEILKTYINTTYFYTDKDTELYVIYPNLQKNMEYENTSSKNGGFSVDEEGSITLKDALFNGGIIKILDALGQLLLKLDTTGQHFYDTSGNEIGDIGLIEKDGTKQIAFSINGVDDSNKMVWGVKYNDSFIPVFLFEGYNTETGTEVGGKFIFTAPAFIQDGALFLGGDEDAPYIQGNSLIEKNISFCNVDDIFFTNAKLYSENYLSSDGLSKAIFSDNIYFISAYFSAQGIYVSDGEGTHFSIYASSSDEKLKKNIKDTEVNAIETIKKINHKQFDWKETGKHQDIGYIAQEMEKINENFVHHNIFKDKDNNDVEDWQINILSVLATATKAIQEQQEQIEELQKQINEMKGENHGEN